VQHRLSLAPPLVDAFYRRHPDVEVSLALDCTVRPVESLLEGKLDVAIVTQSIRNDQVRIRPLFEDEHAAIVSPHHPFAKRAFVGPEDLASERLLLYSTSPAPPRRTTAYDSNDPASRRRHAAARVPHVEAFIDLLVRQALPARRLPLRVRSRPGR
jgi:DNA-binding transcriptional LysR family regulator